MMDKEKVKEYWTKIEKYKKKAAYYRRKAEKLEDEMFWEMNKDNEFLNRYIKDEN